MKYCDLHAHSTCSDGSFTPEQVLELARNAEMGAIVLCDHNVVTGLPAFLEAAKGKNIEAVPGVEFSTDYDGKELHMIALYVRPQFYCQIEEMMQDVMRRKEQSNVDLVAALNRAGFEISLDKIRAGKAHGFVNRAHIAQEMTAKGYTVSTQEAFKKYLNVGAGYYIPPQRICALDMIRYIKSIGAVAVLAHPLLSLDEASLRKFLPEAKACGLDAMEVLYSKYDARETALAKQLAEEFGLLPSGGSDFHGAAKPDIQIGSGRGDLAVPMEYLEALKTRIGSCI